MSSSYRRDRVHWISIHKVLSNVTLDDFKARRELLFTKYMDIPVVKRNVLKSDFVISNDILDGYVQAAGLPAPSSVMLLGCECESRDRIVQITEDQDVQQLLIQEFPELRPGQNVSVLTVDSKILVEKASLSGSTNRVHRFAILDVHDGVASQDCEEKLDAILEWYDKLAVVQKNVLRRTVFAPGVDHLDSVMRQLDVQVAKQTYIIQEEYENQEDMMEVLNSAEFKQILVESNKTFDTNIFCANVITMLNQN